MLPALSRVRVCDCCRCRYCNRNSSLSAAAVGIDYDTAGWVSTVTGDTCLSTNESLPSPAFGPYVEPLLRGLRDVAWYDASQGTFITTMPLTDGNVTLWLANVSSLLAPWPPDTCETVRDAEGRRAAADRRPKKRDYANATTL